VRRIRPPDPALLRAYYDTAYRIAPFTLRIGQTLKPWPFSVPALVLIGACNPGGRRMPDRYNQRAMTALHAILDRALRSSGSGLTPVVLCGEGVLGQWQEPFFAVPLSPDRARVLGRQFGQNALVIARRGQKARLVWLCDRLALTEAFKARR